MTKGVRLAAIDVGSNTVHLLVASLVEGSPPRQLFRHRSFVQLGLDVAATGEIGERRLELAAETLAAQVAEARRRGARKIAVGATQALRSAANGPEIAAVLAERSGVDSVRILPSAVEAQLAFDGASLGLAPRVPCLVMDIGGASTEVILGPAGGIARDQSLSLGSGTLLASVEADPPLDAEWRAMERLAQAGIPDLVPPPPQTLALGTGGTITNLPRLLGKEKGASLRPREVELLLELFRVAPTSVLAERSGLDLERVRLCRGGAVILAQLMDLLRLRTVRASERGLRDGMILALRRRGRDWWRPENPVAPAVPDLLAAAHA